jgi:hypothetical protein
MIMYTYNTEWLSSEYILEALKFKKLMLFSLFHGMKLKLEFPFFLFLFITVLKVYWEFAHNKRCF